MSKSRMRLYNFTPTRFIYGVTRANFRFQHTECFRWNLSCIVRKLLMFNYKGITKKHMLFLLFSIQARTDVHLGKCDWVFLYNTRSRVFLQCVYSFWTFQALKMEAARSFEASITIYQSTRLYITEDSSLYHHRFKAVTRLAGRAGFDPRPVRVGFVVDKVALGQVSLRVLTFPLSIIFHQCSILINSSSIL